MAWFHQPRAQILRFYGLIMFWNEFRIIWPQNLGSSLMKSSQSNFNLRSPSSYLVRSYLIATVRKMWLFSITLLYPTIDFTCLNLWQNVKFNNILWNRRSHKSSNIKYLKSSGLDPICFAQILHHTFESLQVIFISVIVHRSYRPVHVLLSIFYPNFIQIKSG